MKRRSKINETSAKNLKSNQKQNRVNNNKYILNHIGSIPEDKIETQIPDDQLNTQELKYNPNSSSEENKTYTSLKNVDNYSEVVFVSMPVPALIMVEDESTTSQFLRDLFADSQPAITTPTTTIPTITTPTTTISTKTTPTTTIPTIITPTTTIATITVPTTTIATITIPTTTITTTILPTTSTVIKNSKFSVNQEIYMTSNSSSSNSSSPSDSSSSSSDTLSSISSLSDISNISLESAKKQLKKYHYQYLKAERAKRHLKKKLKRIHKKKSFMEYTIDESGDFTYENGITITKLQDVYLKKIPDTEKGDRKYINTLLQIIFGTDTLKECSRTGRSRSGTKTKQLDPIKNDFVQRMFWERIKHSKHAKDRFSVYNKSVNRKIQNCKITAKKMLMHQSVETSIEAVITNNCSSEIKMTDGKREKKEKRKQAKQERKDKKKRKNKNMDRINM